jgi:signal transduction histidine kinase/CheY-like chemotaxis protein
MESNNIIGSISKGIDAILSKENLKDICNEILMQLLHVTNNKMGYVAELKYSEKGSPFFRYKAVAFKSKKDSFNEYYKKHFLKNDNLDFYDMNTLYGIVYKTGKHVISNDVMNDNRRGGISKLPTDHPIMNKFMGIPLIYNSNLIGMIGLAEPDNNKDYCDKDLEIIEPFASLFIFAFVYWKRREAINSSRNHFLLHMSHEIKTPLNGIFGMTQHLLDTDLTTEQLDIIRVISQCNLRLLTIVNDIADFYRITVGEVELVKTPLSIMETIEEVYKLYEDDFKSKNIQFKYTIDDNIKGDIVTDKKRITQILVNLLSNAISYTYKGSIEINAYINKEKTNEYLKKIKKEYNDDANNSIMLTFDIRDTGIGIPKEKLEVIYHDFKNLEEHLVVNPGSGRGLGLSISRLLTKILGGDIEINSEIGTGTIVSFTIKTEISDNVQLLKDTIRKTLDGKYMMILDKDANDRIKMSNMFISLGMIPIIPSSTGEAEIYIKNAKIQFSIVIIADKLFEPDLIMEIKTLYEYCIVIGICQNKSVPYIDYYLPLNYDETELIKIIYNSIKGDSLEQIIDSDVNLSDKITNIKKAKYYEPKNNVKIYSNVSKEELMENNNIRILIAEDEVANQKVINTVLIKLGYTDIDIVSNGKLMFESAIQKDYDVIFVDIRMPIMDGFQATSKILEYYNTINKKYPFIIAVTALEDLHMNENCSKIGIHYLLKKPFNFGSIKKIMKIVKKHKAKINKNFNLSA